jgi:hypothetical protein
MLFTQDTKPQPAYTQSKINLTVIRFKRVSAKFGTCTVVSVNGTIVEDKMRRCRGECAHFSFNKCPIYTHDGASGKFFLALTHTIRITVLIPLLLSKAKHYLAYTVLS